MNKSTIAERLSIIYKTDTYKVTHWLQFPKRLEYAQYYVESRCGLHREIMVAGIERLKKVLARAAKAKDVKRMRRIIKKHLGKDLFNFDGWMTIVTELHGKLPLRIRAVKEGTIVPIHNVIMTIENTDPRFAWLSGYIEPFILRSIWHPTNVSTLSFELKKLIYSYLNKTTDDSIIDEILPSRMHDFSARGDAGDYAAENMYVHGYNFAGTDTIEALVTAEDIFGDFDQYSVPAREHSTTTIYGNEDGAFLNSINQWGDMAYSCVLDSFDYEAALERVTTGEIRDAIMSQSGCFIERPDSGDPVDVVMRALEITAKNVGYTINSKGYKVLDPHYRIIQGDGVDYDKIEHILNWMEANKWSTENVAFGMGGALGQGHNRDTHGFAMKMCCAVVEGKFRRVNKKPKTDPNKASKSGYLDLIINEKGEYETVSFDTFGQTHQNSVLVEHFLDGVPKKVRKLKKIKKYSDAAVKARKMRV